jgi:ribonuclease BN (tRNA processing enzyme)
MIALDMGSGVFERLNRLCKAEKLQAVVLSHLHHDHIADMGVFNYYLEVLAKRENFTRKIPCYAPAEGGVYSFEQLKTLFPYFEFIPVRDGMTAFIGNTKAEFLKLAHGVTNYGVRLTEQTGRRLAYSGDTNVCANLDKLISACDLWLGGAPFIGKEYQREGGHLSAEVMQMLAERYSVRAVLTHLCPVHEVREYQRACTDDFVEVAKAFRSYRV